MKDILGPEMEDKLYDQKRFFVNFQIILEELFEKNWLEVLEDMKKSNKEFVEEVGKNILKDYFFDYMYNETENIDFFDYLNKYSKFIRG
jgi:hypothetical protein